MSKNDRISAGDDFMEFVAALARTRRQFHSTVDSEFPLRSSPKRAPRHDTSDSRRAGSRDDKP